MGGRGVLSRGSLRSSRAHNSSNQRWRHCTLCQWCTCQWEWWPPFLSFVQSCTPPPPVGFSACFIWCCKTCSRCVLEQLFVSQCCWRFSAKRYGGQRNRGSSSRERQCTREAIHA